MSSSDASKLHAEIAAAESSSSKRNRSTSERDEFDRASSASSSHSASTGSNPARLASRAELYGAFIGALGEANLPGEMIYFRSAPLQGHVRQSRQTLVASGTVETHQVPFSYLDEQISRTDNAGFAERLFRTSARSLAARLHGINVVTIELRMRQLKVRPEQLVRWSTFDHAALSPSLVAAVRSSIASLRSLIS